MIYIKLCLVLGIPWIFECLHYLIHWNHEHLVVVLPESYCASATEIFFRICGGLNISRGVFIFIIFVCKWTIWDKLKKTFPFKQILSSIESHQMKNGANKDTVKSMETLTTESK